MNNQPIEWQRDEYTISTQRSKRDLDVALALLRATHWGHTLTRSVLERAVANSVCFGMYHKSVLIGFGRVVTDLATYGYLTDIVIASQCRGRGLRTWLAHCIVTHPDMQGFRRLALLTRDATVLYARAGFSMGPSSSTYMERQGSAPGGADPAVRSANVDV